MAITKFKGSEVHTSGDLPTTGETAPPFRLVGIDLQEKTLEDFAGKPVVMTINPSYDTGVCAATARAFNEKAGESGAKVLMISADLPFAQKRFCAAEGLEHVTPLSSFRSSFAHDYGIALEDGPLQGVTARAVIVLDGKGKVLYSSLSDEITEEPDYQAALAVLE